MNMNMNTERRAVSALLPTVFLLVGSFLMSTVAHAGWSLDVTQSKVNFISVKKGAVGELHTFKSISGVIDEKGKAELSIDLSSVETNIDIRNTRMIEHLFEVKTHPKASFTAQLDMAVYDALKVGHFKRQQLKGSLDLHGVSLDSTVEVVVQKLAGGSLLVVSESPLLIKTKTFDLDGGVDKLKELAKLPSISRVVPVTFSLIFEK